MEETALSPPPTIDTYLESLKAVHASIVADLDSSLRSQVELVEKTLRAKGASEHSAAPAALAEVRRVRSEDVSVLPALEEAGRELSKKVKAQLGEVVSRHVEIDVGYLFEQGIGDIIRDFRPVSADTTQQALSNFVKGASNGDDFRLCLKAGADLNGLVEGQTALIKAVCANHTEAFEMILEDGADLEAKAGVAPRNVRGVVATDTAVVVASRHGRWGMVRSLIAKGADVDAVGGDGQKVLQVACATAERQLDPSQFGLNISAAPLDSWRLQYDPQNGNPAVRSAVSEALKDLLMNTSDIANRKINARLGFYNESLVQFFAWHEFEELMLLALSRGVDIDALNGTLQVTALVCAAVRGRPEFVQTLVDNGADVNKRFNNDMTTPIMAVPSGTYAGTLRANEASFVSSVRAVLGILLDRGADVNARTLRGQTAIHRAVEWGTTVVVQFLVERGADLRVRNEAGRTPHELAVELGRPPQMVALLVPPANQD
uniref:Uncharacterized protein n=1 Tax=Chromera velia CCMP2878 TaxID=1169474 RepID=A0A0G4H880_9ALVE|eukprot:Cvel_5876.t1-p1 / transcript=Cvel_5876.t1 / gene=Cvel_5876 / organism=Chromera_velia_CCMP2878 / gene_product=Ankyrin repeat domain-containing protein 17, putative / transcript_product=Ankyrin repeat domain-containing protein 17, putative / location=Cvel_scaffold279:102034-103497(-) / protein_length=488 / sequence_SO=supercontig / SO=protein_coding / is_pseudo=false